LQCNYTRRIPEVWETITKFIELTKSNDYFNENAWNRTNIDARGTTTIEGYFITIPKYKTCWNQLKRCKTVKYHHLQPLSYYWKI
jgi:hypothetical protein